MVTVRNVSGKPKMIAGRLVWPGQTAQAPEKLARRLSGVRILGQPYQDQQPRLRFAFAGRFEQSQDELAQLATKAGHSVGELVGDTDYLVAGQRPGKALNRAESLGVSVLSEAEFLKMVRP